MAYQYPWVVLFSMISLSLSLCVCVSPVIHEKLPWPSFNYLPYKESPVWACLCSRPVQWHHRFKHHHRLWWCALHMAGQLFPISHTMYLQTTYVYPTLSSQELAGSNIKVCSYGRQPLSLLVCDLTRAEWLWGYKLDMYNYPKACNWMHYRASIILMCMNARTTVSC